LVVCAFFQWYRINRIFKINRISLLLVNVLVGKRRIGLLINLGKRVIVR